MIDNDNIIIVADDSDLIYEDGKIYLNAVIDGLTLYKRGSKAETLPLNNNFVYLNSRIDNFNDKVDGYQTTISNYQDAVNKVSNNYTTLNEIYKYETKTVDGELVRLEKSETGLLQDVIDKVNLTEYTVTEVYGDDDYSPQISYYYGDVKFLDLTSSITSLEHTDCYRYWVKKTYKPTIYNVVDSLGYPVKYKYNNTLNKTVIINKLIKVEQGGLIRARVTRTSSARNIGIKFKESFNDVFFDFSTSYIDDNDCTGTKEECLTYKGVLELDSVNVKNGNGFILNVSKRTGSSTQYHGCTIFFTATQYIPEDTKKEIKES